jgi:hypothetical protein
MAIILFSVGLVFAASGKTQRPGMSLTGVGMMFAAGYMSLKGRCFARVDYAAPAQAFLAAAVRRYRFWPVEEMLFALPLLLILGAGGGWTVWLTALKYFSRDGTCLAMAGYVVFFLGVCVFGWIASRKQWQRESAALLADIERRRRELENG